MPLALPESTTSWSSLGLTITTCTFGLCQILEEVRTSPITMNQPLCVLPGHEGAIHCVRYNKKSAIVSCGNAENGDDDYTGVIKLWTSRDN